MKSIAVTLIYICCCFLSLSLCGTYHISINNSVDTNEIKRLFPNGNNPIDTTFIITRLNNLSFIENTKVSQSTNDSTKYELTFDTTSSYDVSHLGGALKGKKHGKESSFPRILLEAELRKNNFFGSLSTFALRAGGWSDRYLRATWLRPLTYRLDLELSSEIGHYPSEIEPWTLNFYNRNKISLHILNSSYLTISPQVIPSYYRYKYPGDIEDNYSELSTAIQLVYERRDNSLNPRKGFYFSSELVTNALYPYKDNTQKYRHLTLTYDISAYIPLWKGKHTFCAYLSQNSVLAGDKVPYERLYLGGTKNVRGFETGEFGHETNFENRIESTLAYRFSLFRIPSIKLPFLTWYDKNLKDFPVDIDGGVFLDGGYLWPELDEMFTQELSYSALSVGAGLRIALPTVDILGAIDVAVPLYATIKPEKKPHLHIYIELPF